MQRLCHGKRRFRSWKKERVLARLAASCLAFSHHASRRHVCNIATTNRLSRRQVNAYTFYYATNNKRRFERGNLRAHFSWRNAEKYCPSWGHSGATFPPKILFYLEYRGDVVYLYLFNFGTEFVNGCYSIVVSSGSNHISCGTYGTICCIIIYTIDISISKNLQGDGIWFLLCTYYFSSRFQDCL